MLKPYKKRNEYVFGALKIIGNRLVFVILSVFLIPFIGTLMSFNLGQLLFSFILSLVILPTIYVNGWDLGHRERKAHKRGDLYGKYNPYLLKGVAIGALSEIFSLICFAATCCKGFGVWNLIYLCYQMPFIGFIYPNTAVLTEGGAGINWFIPMLIIPACYGGGYIAGWFDRHLLERLIPKILYRDADKKRR